MTKKENLIVVPTEEEKVKPFNYVENEATQIARDKAENYNDFSPSESTLNAKEQWDSHSNLKPAEWNGGSYYGDVNDAWNKIQNREAFTYDLNGDALYQQYKNQYMREGKLAMQDAYGQASALTGGYGNSYAATVGNQAYQNYLGKLNDVIPQLYQLAYDKYKNETSEYYNQYNLAKNAYDTEYGEYRNMVSDWQNEDSRLANNYYNQYNIDRNAYDTDRNNAYNVYNNERNFDYGQQTDSYNMALNKAQFDETVRSNDETIRKNKADEAYRNAQLEQKYATTDSTPESNSVEEVKRAESSENVKAFNSSIMSEKELRSRGFTATINGNVKKFDSYKAYVDAVLEKWFNAGQIDESEVAYLKGQYGL